MLRRHAVCCRALSLHVFLPALLLLLIAPLSHATVDENEDCCDINPDATPGNNIGFKVNVAGTALNNNGNPWLFVNNGDITTITCNSDVFQGNTAYQITFTTNQAGTVFDFMSTIPLDAVIVKGGASGSEVYIFDQEQLSGTGLHAPPNVNGSLPLISHVEVCFDIELEVTKTVETSYIQTFPWTIDKSVVPENWDFFTGDDGTSIYSVNLTKGDPVDSEWQAWGYIMIENPSPFDAVVTAVTDVAGGIPASVVCPVQLPHTMAPGESLICTYSCLLPDGTQRLNTATAEVSEESLVGGNSGTAMVVFGDPASILNNQVSVIDSWKGPLGTFSASATVDYPRNFNCNDEGTEVNTAMIVETGQWDDATVNIACYSLDVSKTANTAFMRDYNWWMEKSASESSLTLAPGQVYTVTYAIEMFADFQDLNHRVDGTVVIHNPAPVAAMINSVADLITPGDIPVYLDFNITFPFSLGPEKTLSCSYSCQLDDGAMRTNTLRVSLQNYSYDFMTATPSGTTEFSGSAPVDFGQATVLSMDECISLYDNMLCPPELGGVCYDHLPYQRSYTFDFGPYSEPDDCGSFVVTNLCAFISGDNGDMGKATYDLPVTVACSLSGGCTLTFGYWKTHSGYGPAPYDDNWENLGDVDGDGVEEYEDENFFASGQTYYEVLWTAPAGNVYYILARQYIATELNFLNGADPSDAQEAFDNATGLLTGADPAQVALLKGKARKPWINAASVLDDYNNGTIGPGHCTDNSPEFQDEAYLSEDDMQAKGEPEYLLLQNYPNPFDQRTKFTVTVPGSGRVEINIYSLDGKKIDRVFGGELLEGSHTFNYQPPSGIAPGVYIYSLESPEIRLFRKMSIY